MVGESCELTDASGSHELFTNCCRTAPMARSEASVVIDSGAPWYGWESSVASANAFLVASNAFDNTSLQIKVFGLSASAV